MDCQIIILAGGDGKRMDTFLPKVMNQVQGKPMLEMVIDNVSMVTNDIILVHSEKLFDYIQPYKNVCKFALQKEPLGTAHAAYSALKHIDNNKINLIIYGDNPFIASNIMSSLIQHLVQTDAALVILGFMFDKPNQCGKIVTDSKGNLLKIVEFKQATDIEKCIKLCNSGIMAFKPGILHKYLPYCLNQTKCTIDEFYLTQLVEICQNQGERINYLISSDDYGMISINTNEDLLSVNKITVD